jgi:hypothetical protein
MIGELCPLAWDARVNNAPGNNVCPSPTMEHTPRKPRRSNPEKPCLLISALLHHHAATQSGEPARKRTSRFDYRSVLEK